MYKKNRIKEMIAITVRSRWECHVSQETSDMRITVPVTSVHRQAHGPEEPIHIGTLKPFTRQTAIESSKGEPVWRK
jgi:hypothetical protein